MIAEKPVQTLAKAYGADVPLGGYGLLMATYATGVAAALGVATATRKLPARIEARDLALLGVATYRLSRLITKDKVTAFLRSPVARRAEESDVPSEVEDEARGHGLQHAVGELVTCPYCVATWVATGLTMGLVLAPRATRVMSSALVVQTLSDSLQMVHKAAWKGLGTS